MIEKTIHNIALYAIVFIGILLTLSSCMDEEVIDTRDNGRITFFVTDKTQSDNGERQEAISKEEKSQTPDKSIIEIDGKQLNLQYSCEKNEIALNRVPVTRGAAFDNNTHCITHIYTTAISENGDGGDIYFEKESISINNNQGSSTHFWTTGKLSFFAYACSKENVTISPLFVRENKVCKGMFDYTLPAATGGSTPKDATNQPDVVFAIAPDMAYEKSSNVDLVFHHALSAIQFKVGRMPDEVFIKSITISGVYASGHCDMTANDSTGIDFTWSHNGHTADNLYTENIEQNAAQGNTLGDNEAVFMMLPQTMNEETKFILSFEINGHEYSFEKKFNDFITSWEADKKYIFTIGLPDEIDVEIDDQVNGMVKNNVTIQNTGIHTGYIRAAIVGYWLNASGQICDSWQDSDGTFVYGNQWDNYWEKGDDGFYYYMQPVKHNEYTYPLFDKYTISSDIVNNHTNHKLEIDLAVQIIPIENKDVWQELNDL